MYNQRSVKRRQSEWQVLRKSAFRPNVVSWARSNLRPLHRERSAFLCDGSYKRTFTKPPVLAVRPVRTGCRSIQPAIALLAAAMPIVHRMFHATSAALATSGGSPPGPAARDERVRALSTAWVEPDRRGCCGVLGNICFRNSHPLVFGEVFADKAKRRLTTNPGHSATDQEGYQGSDFHPYRRPLGNDRLASLALC